MQTPRSLSRKCMIQRRSGCLELHQMGVWLRGCTRKQPSFVGNDLQEAVNSSIDGRLITATLRNPTRRQQRHAKSPFSLEVEMDGVWPWNRLRPKGPNAVDAPAD